MSATQGNAITVSGIVDPSTLGFILPHEHVATTLPAKVFTPSKPFHNIGMSQKPVTLENLWWIRQFPYTSEHNMIYNDDATKRAIEDEMRFLRESVGQATVVECTSIGMGRDISLMASLHRNTGINFVAGTGYYVWNNNPESVLELTVEEVYRHIISECGHVSITDNQFEPDIILTEATSLRCGIIGEIGTSYPLHPFEKRVLEASGMSQEQIGAPVMIHPGRHTKAPREALRVFLEAGGNPTHTTIAHLDRTLTDIQDLLEFADQYEVYCEFDLFGQETSHYQPSLQVDMISDAQRIELIKSLVKDDKSDRVLISHDIHTKHRLMAFGGHGFSHIPLNIIPKLQQRGFTDGVIEQITRTNPQTWLTWFK